MALLDSPATLSAEQSALVNQHNAAVAAITSAAPYADQNEVVRRFPRDVSTIAGARKILADALQAEVTAITEANKVAHAAAQNLIIFGANNGGRLSGPTVAQTVPESGQDAKLRVAETRRKQLEDYSSTTLPFGLNLLTLEFAS